MFRNVTKKTDNMINGEQIATHWDTSEHHVTRKKSTNNKTNAWIIYVIPFECHSETSEINSIANSTVQTVNNRKCGTLFISSFGYWSISREMKLAKRVDEFAPTDTETYTGNMLNNRKM